VRFDLISDQIFSEAMDTVDLNEIPANKLKKIECMSLCRRTAFCGGISLSNNGDECLLASETTVEQGLLQNRQDVKSYQLVPESQLGSGGSNNFTNNRVGEFGYPYSLMNFV